MARLKQATTLQHRANLAEDVEPIEFESGSEFSVLREWSQHYLCKDARGRLFTIAKELIEID